MGGATHSDGKNTGSLKWTHQTIRDPTHVPTPAPSANPTYVPTPAPTVAPSELPTAAPTESPTEVPTTLPPTTDTPTFLPTITPTERPTVSPTQTPTEPPTPFPTASPTASPCSGYFVRPPPRQGQNRNSLPVISRLDRSNQRNTNMAAEAAACKSICDAASDCDSFIYRSHEGSSNWQGGARYGHHHCWFFGPPPS